MRKIFEIGGLVTAVVLIGFGVVAIAMGVSGRSTVQDSLRQEPRSRLISSLRPSWWRR
jgi:hypothetical protein